METKVIGLDRRQFLSGVSLAAAVSTPLRPVPAELAQPADSQQTPGVRMSMVSEDLPPGAEIEVHLHEREDEIIFIRTGRGMATLGDREVPVAAGATICAPQGVWHGLRNTGDSTLGMNAIYSPPGFEQAFKDSLRPNRTQAEIQANRKKHGIVYRSR